MIIKSFIKNDFSLTPIDMEMALVPGLPQITIVGLPDKMIQEGTKRVQTALLSQGFQMPKAKQVLVNLSPHDVRKSSLGLDLPIALGILSLTGQRGDIPDQSVVYGRLNLDGEVFAPRDIENLRGQNLQDSRSLITGGPERAYHFPVKILKNLKDEGAFAEAVEQKNEWQRPPFPVESFSPRISHLLKVIAVGEHSTIVAGPPGGGKSTFVETVSALIDEPRDELMEESLKLARYFNHKLNWRPIVSPHHSISAISMVGGGTPPRPGDIVRAHGGVLILEELLEFNTQVQSALREPLEKGSIQVSRGMQSRHFPARCLALATTNLCKCGEFVPGSHNRCRCSSTQLRRYLEKFSGPFVDRFSCLLLSQDWKTQDSFGETAVKSSDLLKECESIRQFIRQDRGQLAPNEQLSESEIVKSLDRQGLLNLLPLCRSHRRRRALLRVARTLADLEYSSRIQIRHLNEAQNLAYDPFLKVRELC